MNATATRCGCEAFAAVTEAASLASGRWLGRGDVEGTREHLALPLARLPEFTRWRVARDRDFDPVRAQLNI